MPGSVAAQEYELVPIASLLSHPANPRRGDIESIRQSIVSNDFYGAIVAQRSTGYVVAGNHRLMAAREVGLSALPVIWVDVDDAVARRILAVDNRTNDLAAYDDGALVALLQQAASDGDLAGTGYEPGDLDALLALLTPVQQQGSDEDVLEETEAAAWPTIKVQVPPEIYALWLQVEGDDDTERMVRLLNSAGAAAVDGA